MHRRLLPVHSALLLWAMTGVLGAIDIGSPMHCSTYSVGADTHTECSPGAAAPPGAAIRCQDHTVGTDTHTECVPVAEAGLGALRARKVLPATAPVRPLHCYTYRIGASTYTDCR